MHAWTLAVIISFLCRKVSASWADEAVWVSALLERQAGDGEGERGRERER